MTTHDVRLPSGTVSAVVEGGVLRARGIAYAHAQPGMPPVPAPVSETVGVVASPQPVEADTEALLGFDPLGGMTQQEDCLRVSVTAPEPGTGSGRAPVLVWIHGGGYRTGAGDSPIYDPTALVTEGGVVFVAVTYRLGPLGFLRTDAGQPANLGLLDVHAALTWVQENIAAFGGDPRNVTLFGQSSGADLIAKVLSLPEAGALVRRAILQSAPLGIANRPAGLDDLLAVIGGEVARRTREGDPTGACAAVDEAARPFGLAGLMPFSAEFGEHPLSPRETALASTFAQAGSFDLLIGYTAEETRYFLPMLQDADPRLRIPVVGPLISRLVVRVTSALVYSRANRSYARRFARGGGRVTRYVLQANRGRPPFGAGHTVDLGLLFPRAGATEQEQRDGATLRAAWLEFAHTGAVSIDPARRTLFRPRRVRS